MPVVNESLNEAGRGRFKCQCHSPALPCTGCCCRIKKSTGIHLWNKKVGGREKIHRLRKTRASLGA